MKITAPPSRLNKLAAMLLLAACWSLGGIPEPALAASPPSWQSTAVIYDIYPQIFSSSGLSGVDSALQRLKSLGVTVLWLMPFQPLGQTITFDGVTKYPLNPPTPYCQSNLTGIDPAEGTSADLTKLITDAHAEGMHVIMDVALNQTAWSDALVQSTPQYYYNSGNIDDPATIENAFPNGANDSDIAGVNITTNANGAQTYMTSVCQYWLSNFDFDGFRFDSADSPKGSSRDFLQSYAQSIYSSLNPNNTLMWLEEGESPQLANSPYTLDYDWDLSFYAQNSSNGNFLLQNVAKNGSGVSTLESTYNNDAGGGSYGFPSGYQHMAFLQDWDTDQDYNLCGGYPQVLDAAVFDLTIPGVPMIYNGEEVGNDQGSSGLNHTAIDWNSPNSAKFQSFYTTMIGNRAANPALQQGSLTFESNSNSSNNVATYDRLSGSSDCYVEINFSGSTQTGTCTVPSGSSTWTDISPSVSPGGTSHTLPSTGNFSLAPYDYAVFKRGAPSAPPTPTGLTATPGNGQVILSWTASSGATSYNVYRSTASGGEGATPIGTTATTRYTDSGLTNGTKYYYKVAAVNSVGTSAQSGEASAIPSGSAPTGSLTGSVTSVGSATTYNLTALGTSDWTAWGTNGGYDHDSSGGSKISNLTAAGGSLNSFTSNYLGFTWTNGTPDSSETNETNGYYNNAGVGDGFSFTVPAGTTSQNLTVYVGGWTSGGTLTATLSDGSATAYTNSSLSNSGNSYYGYYTLAFKAASAGQTLTVTWKESSGSGNVTIYAAYLTGGVSVPAAPTGLTATPGNAQVALSWTASSGATSYNIYRSTTSGGEGTTAIGTTSSTAYTDSGLTNGTKYYYKVAAVNSAGTSAQSSEQSATPSASGSLTGSVTSVTSPTTYNLTTQGATDWSAWGYDGFDHKSSGGTKISNVSAVGGSLNSFTSSYLGFTWTDGTPDTSVTGETNGYYNNAGVGDGFSFTVPAGTTSQNLTVYLGGWTSSGTLTATLSDGSAASYSNSSLSNSGNSYYGYYTLAYKAASANQTLTVTWKQNSGSGNVTIYGAALH